jgi:beta-phosphoglucomutase-like phosphatase (HAD superfamily)
MRDSSAGAPTEETLRYLRANGEMGGSEGLPLPAGAADLALPVRRRSAPSGSSRLLGSDTNFAATQSVEPAGPASGWANLGSDPKNRSVGALIFDMDGTMIDSMPHHAQSWVVFTRRHNIDIDVDDLMRRTTGRTGAECMQELFQREIEAAEALALIDEKEVLYRELFGPVFAEVAGFNRFAARAQAQGLKVGVGTAGDKHNIAFALAGLKMAQAPLAIVGGDEGFPGKPEPAIFLEVARRLGARAQSCIVFEDAPFGIEAARRAGMRAVAICSTHSPQSLAGPHVIASVRDYNQLLDTDFLGKFHAATA